MATQAPAKRNPTPPLPETPPKDQANTPPPATPPAPAPEDTPAPKPTTPDPYASLELATDGIPHPKFVEFVNVSIKNMKEEQHIPLPTRTMFTDVCDKLGVAARAAGYGMSAWEWTDPPSRVRDSQEEKDKRTFKGVAFKVTEPRGARPKSR